MLNARLERLNDYPFQRLADLLQGSEPRANIKPLLLHVGEPQHKPPAFAIDAIGADRSRWNLYPPLVGTPALREACAGYLQRRYGVPASALDPHKQIAPVAGSREGLFMVALLAISPPDAGPKPIALMPNPFYQVYFGAAVMAGAEPVFLPTSAGKNWLPDLDAIPPATLERTQIFYLCSPANPQGTCADLDYWKKALTLARRHGFMLVADECYADLYYTPRPPVGAIEAAVALGPGPDGHVLDNLIVSHTVSKRSSAPGMRSAFVAGSPTAIAMLNRLRSYEAASISHAVMDASVRLWNDDAHADESREIYARKYDIADRLFAGRFDYYRPAGGFYLWLNVGDGEAATRRLWTEAGIKVLPGGYLTKPDADGRNFGTPYIRIALVQELDATEIALTRMAQVFDAMAAEKCP
ncbi:MAG: aminotransferase class I/II-fold pyridoxal phosphate-dependent enzyme [Alphaproteobacteria bacterium]|nr:aminotransferase class I/II-fold pyridoxal phosphate-dependent enzyme [Alphaproteobacteria bacterium]